MAPNQLLLPNDLSELFGTVLASDWQRLWSETPDSVIISYIKDTVSRWLSRTAQVILTKLCIGHTRLTHGHLMSAFGDPAPNI